MKRGLFIVGAAAFMATPAWAGTTEFITTARGEGAIPPHQIHLWDGSGGYMGAIDQVAGAQSSAWGYRDGARGVGANAGFVYFGWENGVARHSTDGSGGVEIISGGAPGGVGTWRAMAYDPTLDGGNGGLWVQSFGSDLVAVDLSGGLITTHANNGSSLYGLAYDEATGMLWGHDSSGVVVEIDPSDGSLTGNSFGPGGWSGPAAQGGLSSVKNGSGEIAALMQGDPDEWAVYSSAHNGSFTMGPFDADATTGSDGNLGIVWTGIIPAPGAVALLGVAGLVARRRRRA